MFSTLLLREREFWEGKKINTRNWARKIIYTHSLVASPPNHKIPHASLVSNVVYSRCGVVYPDLSPVFCLQLLEKGLLIEGISFTGKQFIDWSRCCSYFAYSARRSECLCFPCQFGGPFMSDSSIIHKMLTQISFE